MGVVKFNVRVAVRYFKEGCNRSNPSGKYRLGRKRKIQCNSLFRRAAP